MAKPDPIDAQILALQLLIADLKSAADRVTGVVAALSEVQQGIEHDA